MKTYLTTKIKDELIDILELHKGYFGADVDHIMQALKIEASSLDVNKQAELIIESVANVTGVSVEEIKSPKRVRNVAIARQYAIYQVYEQLYMHGISLSQIGRIFHRDHSTIMYSVKSISEGIKYKDALIMRIHEIYEQ